MAILPPLVGTMGNSYDRVGKGGEIARRIIEMSILNIYLLNGGGNKDHYSYIREYSIYKISKIPLTIYEEWVPL